MIKYDSLKEIVKRARSEHCTISKIVLTDQAIFLERNEEDIFAEMKKTLRVMKESISRGIKNQDLSISGLSGMNTSLYESYIKSGKSICGSILSKVILYSLAVSEQNACMGRIVASPTAGSCGVLPAVITALAEEHDICEENQIMALFTAGAVGMVIATLASVSGARSGCQAECGSAAAMASAACTELFSGSPAMVENACALALKNMLGLVCDPVAGLVEVPCVKRNAVSASIAISSADMALSGIQSVIPADEVILAMRSIGDLLPSSLKETSKAGLAVTPSGRSIAEKFLNDHALRP